MSPVDPPSRCARLVYATQLLRLRAVNFLARYVDLDDLYKTDGRGIARRIALSSIFFNLPLGFISLWFLGYTQIIGGIALVGAVVTYILEKPVELDGAVWRRLTDPKAKIFVLVIFGILSMLSVWTIAGGVLLVCGGLYYVYLFYRGELLNDVFVVKVSEQDIAQLEGLSVEE